MSKSGPEVYPQIKGKAESKDPSIQKKKCDGKHGMEAMG